MAVRRKALGTEQKDTQEAVLEPRLVEAEGR